MYEKEREFVSNILRLESNEYNSLKDAFKKPLSNAPTLAIVSFYKCLPEDVPQKYHEIYFFAAGAFCLKKKEEQRTCSFTDAVRSLSREQNSKYMQNVENKMRLLFMANMKNKTLLLRLMQIIVFLYNKKYTFRVESLINDLCDWDDKNRRIQKKWAREIFSEK